MNPGNEWAAWDPLSLETCNNLYKFSHNVKTCTVHNGNTLTNEAVVTVWMCQGVKYNMLRTFLTNETNVNTMPEII